MGKRNHSPKQAKRRKASWLSSKIQFAKQAYYDNLNKRQKKEYQADEEL